MNCSICLENHNHNETTTLSCNHTFGKTCISQWINHKNTCPLCRAIITIPKPVKVDKIVINNRIYDDNGNLINRRQNYLDLYLDEGRVEYQDLLWNT